MGIAKLAMKAAEMTQRNSLVNLTEDGLKFTALKKLSTAKGSESQLQIARDYFMQAVTPDKTLVMGTALGTAGGVAGALGDVVEAVPAALTGLVHLGAAGVKGVRSALGWDAD